MSISTLRSLRNVEPDIPVTVVDDCSPLDIAADEINATCAELDMQFSEKLENSGFSTTVNRGLQQARADGENAILLNADMRFVFPFVERMEQCKDSQDRPAAVVGALLLFENGLIQHAGIFCSFLSRIFDHRFRYAPGLLPEAQMPKICPVTGAMQFIRHSTLIEVGLYDESFYLGHEDVDYCLRVFEEGLECVYDPGVRAIHLESFFRGNADSSTDEMHNKSLERLYEKHGSTSLGAYIPPIA